MPALRSIVVVGGGVTGWTAAAAVANSLRGMPVEVIVVEQPASADAVPVETLIPRSLSFHAQLGIDEKNIVCATGATFTLGTVLCDRLAAGSVEPRPYGAPGARIGFLPFQHFAVKARACGSDIDINDYSLTAAAATRGAFAHPGGDARNLLSKLCYGLNVEAAAYAEVLRRYARATGASAVPGTVSEVALREGDGFVTHLELQDGRRVAGDFFIDCTGAQSLLMQRALRIPCEDRASCLPGNRLVSVMSPFTGDIDPLRRARAVAGGWLVQVPLQRRLCHLFLYRSDAVTDEAAGAALLAAAPGAIASDVRMMAVRNGWSRSFWHRNCLALGAAAGAFEPLEMTSLHLVQSGITRFLGMLPDTACDARISSEYNRVTEAGYRSLRDWLAVNYVATQSPAALPDSLRSRLRLFAAHGRLPAVGDEYFTEPEWAARLIGAGLWPRDYSPLYDTMDHTLATQHFDRMRRAIRELAAGLPPQRRYIESYCARPPPD